MPWSNLLSTVSLLCGYLILNELVHRTPVFPMLSNIVIFYIFYFVSSCLYIQQQKVGILIKLLIGITVIASFLILLMLFGNERGRILTWFCENRTDVAMAILCVFPFILGYSGIGLKSRVVLGVFFLITLISIDSRTSYVALLVAGCIFYLPYIKAYLIKKKNKWMFLLGMGILGGLLCWGLYSYRSDSVWGRFQIWRITCSLITDAPFGAMEDRCLLMRIICFIKPLIFDRIQIHHLPYWPTMSRLLSMNIFVDGCSVGPGLSYFCLHNCLASFAI